MSILDDPTLRNVAGGAAVGGALGASVGARPMCRLSAVLIIFLCAFADMQAFSFQGRYGGHMMPMPTRCERSWRLHRHT